jgi:hypothetical protein
MVRLKVDVIVVHSTPATLAAKQATTAIHRAIERNEVTQ